MALCPLISSRGSDATCGRLEDGARPPSHDTKEHYCFDVYELCPLFSASAVTADEADYALAVIAEDMHVDLSR